MAAKGLVDASLQIDAVRKRLTRKLWFQRGKIELNEIYGMV